MRVSHVSVRVAVIVSVLAVVAVSLAGCAVPSVRRGPPRFKYTEEQCVGAFIEANQAYRRYKETPPLDTSSFEMALGYFETALAKCDDWEYEDDALSSLGSCYFYIGQFDKAAASYARLAREFPYSDFNLNGYSEQEAFFLRKCSSDKAMEFFRRGSLYELAHRYDLAAIEYTRSVTEAQCGELRERCRDRLTDLRRRGY